MAGGVITCSQVNIKEMSYLLLLSLIFTNSFYVESPGKRTSLLGMGSSHNVTLLIVISDSRHIVTQLGSLAS